MVRFITVEREYGSQGAEFASQLAKRLGWELLDSKLVDQVAQAARVPMDVVQVHDEQIDPWYHRFGRAFWHGSLDRLATREEDRFDGEIFIEYLRQTLRSWAERGSCVIVGRGASSALANVPGAFHIFVYASLARKVKWVTDTFPEKAASAEEEILATNQRRAAYIRRFYGHSWDNPHLYHLMLNSCMGHEAMLGATLEASALTNTARAVLQHRRA
jgi:cytidylate kinase